MNTTATTRSATFNGIAQLAIRNEHGDITVRATTDDGSTHVRLIAADGVDLESVTVCADADHLLIDVPPLLDLHGHRDVTFQLGPISISTGATRVDVEVELPSEATIKARTKSGDIVISGEAGATTAKTGSGDITLDHAQEVHLSTGSGTVSAATCHGGVVTTGAGDITISDVTGHELQCRAGSGDVALRHTRLAQLSVATGSGDITTQLTEGTFVGKSGTGSIDITTPRDTPVWLDLSSGIGRVHKDIDPVGAPQEGQPHLSVKARTGVGNIRIHH